MLLTASVVLRLSVLLALPLLLLLLTVPSRLLSVVLAESKVALTELLQLLLLPIVQLPPLAMPCRLRTG